MATEAIDWPQPPTGTDADDGPTAAYVMGCQFTVSEVTECAGVRWRVPDSLITPPAPASGHYATLWNLDGGGRQAIAAITPIPGGDQDFLFSSPVALVPGVNYAAAVLTVKYTYRSGGGYPFETPSGVASSAGGKLSATSDQDDPPLGDTGLIFYVSPLIGTADDPAEGQAALGLGLAVAATGATDAEGVAALGAGYAVAASGSSPHGGSVALSLGLAPAAEAERPSLGVAALGLGLGLAATGIRDASGTAALGLGLAVAAAGSNGDTGRAVKPWPFPQDNVSGYPWTPRAVKSFGEVSP